MQIVLHSLFVGVGISIIFVVIAGSGKFRDWIAKLAQKMRKK